MYKTILNTSKALLLVALIGGLALALTKTITIERIKYNEKQTLLKTFNQLLPAAEYDNDPANDNKILPLPTNLSKKVQKSYFARKDGQVVAVFLKIDANEGYSGVIKLLIAVKKDLSIAGVRVLKHQETPGLGDGIEIQKSKWILSFNQKSLKNPQPHKWKVKKDGGEFDQFTGATITPRTIVKAVYHTLEFARDNYELMFAPEGKVKK